MSAETVNALQQRAHQLDAEAESTDTEQRAHPGLLKFLAQEYRVLADLMQGKSPAAKAAEEAAAAGGGLMVEKLGEDTTASATQEAVSAPLLPPVPPPPAS